MFVDDNEDDDDDDDGEDTQLAFSARSACKKSHTNPVSRFAVAGYGNQSAARNPTKYHHPRLIGR